MITKRLQGETLPSSRFSLGRAGLYVNIIAAAFLVLASVLLFFPSAPHPSPQSMNWVCLIFGSTVMFSGLYYVFRARYKYVGPVDLVKREWFASCWILGHSRCGEVFLESMASRDYMIEQGCWNWLLNSMLTNRQSGFYYRSLRVTSEMLERFVEPISDQAQDFELLLESEFSGVASEQHLHHWYDVTRQSERSLDHYRPIWKTRERHSVVCQ